MGLVLKNVSKSFIGKKAVDEISFSLDKPGVFGLLGTNGAGKTTTIRMLLGIIKKDSGEITWNGKKVDRKSVNFGYLPEERGVYPKVKIYDQLIYFAELKGMNKCDADKAIKEWAEKLKVEEYMQVLKGNLREIKDGYKANRVQIEVNKPITEYISNLGLEIENERNNDYTVKINNEEQAHELLKELVKSEVIVNKFEITKPTLNDIYQVLLQQNMLHMH